MRTVRYNDKIDVFFTDELNGGGASVGQEYLELMPAHAMNHKVKRAYEFCSGPGFIGFSLLAHGFCESLCLSDVFPKAVECCNMTVEKNCLNDQVSVYQSDGLDGISESEKWDLVVSNPPHFPALIQKFGPVGENTRLYMDRDWELHRRFYGSVKRFLAEDGHIIMLENTWGSHVETFRDMIESNGMKIVQGHYSHHYPEIYYIYITHA